MKLTIHDTQTTPVTVISSPASDAAGNTGVFNGPLSYTSSDPAIVKVTPSADTLSVDVERAGPLGTATITVTDGIVTASIEVDVVASQAKDILFAVAPAATTESAAAPVAA